MAIQSVRFLLVGSLLGAVSTPTTSRLQAPSVVHDVQYAGSGPLQQLDLYLPSSVRDFPTVIFLHEGGLTSGDRHDEPYARMCERFVSRGIACANTNYRLAPAARWPSQPADAAAAVRWVHANIGSRGGDPSQIYLFGHSSGCHLAAMLATDDRHLQRVGMEPRQLGGVVAMGCLLDPTFDAARVGPERLDRLFSDASSYFSIFGTPEAFNDANPTRHVKAGTPPTLILIAEGEQQQPPILLHAQRFVAAAAARGAVAKFEVLADRTHMTAIRRIADENDPVFGRVLRFVQSRGE